MGVVQLSGGVAQLSVGVTLHSLEYGTAVLFACLPVTRFHGRIKK